MAVERLAVGGWESKFGTEIAKMGENLLVKPQLFMNQSGQVVAQIARFYKVDLANLWIIHDDLDIHLGEYKIQLGVGPKVHNGLSSIELALGNKNFWRVRLGIDNREPPRRAGEDYVLADFLPEERKIFEGEIERAIKEMRAMFS